MSQMYQPNAEWETVRSQLEAWLSGKMPQAHGLSVTGLTGASAGFSNETLFFTLTWQDNGQVRVEELVLRREPAGLPLFPDYDLAKQYRIQELLEPTDIPVPRMRWLEENRDIPGSPFYIMGKTPGAIASSNPPYHAAGLVFEATPNRRKKLGRSAIEVLAKLEKLDWKELGFSFLSAPVPGTTQSIDWELDYYERFLHSARQEEQPILSTALDYLRANRYEVEHISLCWGDPRMQNLVFSGDDGVAAVLDWEMAFLGDPESDLGWFLLADWQASEGYSIPHTEGFPTREETIEYWEKLVGREARHLMYYDIMSAFKYGVVIMKTAKNFKTIGFLPEDHDMDINNPAIRRLAALLELPPPGS